MEIAPNVDVFIVVGSEASSNANRLREVAERLGARAYLANDVSEECAEWFEHGASVAVTASAPTPEHVVNQMLFAVGSLGPSRYRD